MRLIGKSNIKPLLKALHGKYEVMVPQEYDSGVGFKPYLPEKYEPDFSYYGNTKISPKDLFLPQSEVMFTFQEEDEDIWLNTLESKILGKNRIIFGMRSCDVNALLIMDKVFKENLKDSYYYKRRRNTIIVAMACTSPDKDCFCTSFGTGPTLMGGADVLLTDISERYLGSKYLVETFTERGKELIEEYAEFFDPAKPSDLKRKNKLIEEAEKYMRRAPVKEIQRKLSLMFNHPYWETLSKRCFGCASCIFICPTCHCFDMADEYNPLTSEGHMVRCLDSCAFASFTRLAGEDNPRVTKTERLKQRFYHKYKYFKEDHGIFGCVGCGRCINVCPSNIDPREIIQNIANVGEK